jgi:hypothetical protein
VQALARCPFAEPQTDLGFERDFADLVLVGSRGHVSVAEGREGSVPTGALRALRPLARLEALERRTAALESIACLWAAQDPTIPAVATPEPVRELVWSPEQIAWLHHALDRLTGLFRTELSAREEDYFLPSLTAMAVEPACLPAILHPMLHLESVFVQRYVSRECLLMGYIRPSQPVTCLVRYRAHSGRQGRRCPLYVVSAA